LTTPLDQTLLQLKAIGVEDLLRFPYVSRPPLAALRQALRGLCVVGAFDVSGALLERNQLEDYLGSSDTFHLWTRDPTSINPLGMVLSRIPVSPRYAKMLLAAHKYPGLFPYAVMIVACMSVPEIYTQQNHEAAVVVQEASDDDEEDRELVTTIDAERKDAKERSVRRQQRDQRKAAMEKVRAERG
jgi:HrpA-like RNA helicase